MEINVRRVMCSLDAGICASNFAAASMTCEQKGSILCVLLPAFFLEVATHIGSGAYNADLGFLG